VLDYQKAIGVTSFGWGNVRGVHEQDFAISCRELLKLIRQVSEKTEGIPISKWSLPPNEYVNITFIDLQRSGMYGSEVQFISSRGYIEPANTKIRDTARRLISDVPGPYSIDQIDSIYRYLLDNWNYVSDPGYSDLIRYANETLILGEDENFSGMGDCEDFSILLCSLIESIGGTTRIIVVKDNSERSAHAYPEVYLGKLYNSQVENTTNWLKHKYQTNEIFMHIDNESKDVWLNLDSGLYPWEWETHPRKAHPGGPFRPGDEHIILYSDSDRLGKLVPIASSIYSDTKIQNGWIEPYKGTILPPPKKGSINKDNKINEDKKMEEIK